MIASRQELIEEVLAEIDGLMAARRHAFCSHPLHREISLPQLHLLMALQERGPLTVSALAHLLAISAPSASTIVDRVEEHGLVQRERDAEDRRVVHVQISARGRTLVEEMMGLKREQLGRLLGAMTERELEDLLQGIRAVVHALGRLDTLAQG